MAQPGTSLTKERAECYRGTRTELFRHGTTSAFSVHPEPLNEHQPSHVEAKKEEITTKCATERCSRLDCWKTWQLFALFLGWFVALLWCYPSCFQHKLTRNSSFSSIGKLRDPQRRSILLPYFFFAALFDVSTSTLQHPKVRVLFTHFFHFLRKQVQGNRKKFALYKKTVHLRNLL